MKVLQVVQDLMDFLVKAAVRIEEIPETVRIIINILMMNDTQYINGIKSIKDDH